MEPYLQSDGKAYRPKVAEPPVAGDGELSQAIGKDGGRERLVR